MSVQISDAYKCTVVRGEANFDRACDSAFALSINYFGINENGHSDKLELWDRTDSYLDMKFLSYNRTHIKHIYCFETIAMKNIE